MLFMSAEKLPPPNPLKYILVTLLFIVFYVQIFINSYFVYIFTC